MARTWPWLRRGRSRRREIAHVLVDQQVTTAFFTAAIFHRLVDNEIDALWRSA